MAKDKKKATARYVADAPSKSFLDMIAPSVVKFNPDHFICGNTFRCVWALREYPTQTDEQALLRHLGEKDGITLRIYTRQLTPAEEDRIIQNATNKNRMGSSNTNDLRQTVTAESNLQDVASLIASMHRNREPFFKSQTAVGGRALPALFFKGRGESLGLFSCALFRPCGRNFKSRRPRLELLTVSTTATVDADGVGDQLAGFVPAFLKVSHLTSSIHF